jgi:hypothetical protein
MGVKTPKRADLSRSEAARNRLRVLLFGSGCIKCGYTPKQIWVAAKLAMAPKTLNDFMNHETQLSVSNIVKIELYLDLLGIK